MLRADVIVFEKPCFFLSKDQNTSTSICETFEHNAKRSTDLCISLTCNPGRTRTDSERSARSMTTRPDGSGAVDSPSGKGGCLTALPERIVAADWVSAAPAARSQFVSSGPENASLEVGERSGDRGLEPRTVAAGGSGK